MGWLPPEAGNLDEHEVIRAARRCAAVDHATTNGGVMRDQCRRTASHSVEKRPRQWRQKPRQKSPRTWSGKWARVRVASQLAIASLLTVIMTNVAGAMEVRVIYRCQSDSGTTFSDRPCDHSARPYQPDDSRVSSYAPDES